MGKLKLLTGGLVASLVALVVVSAPAMAATGYTLFGDASIVGGGNSGNMAQVNSEGAPVYSYGGVHLNLPSGAIVSDLNTLGTDYKVLVGDCGGGGPRFEVDTAAGNIFIYLGPAPGFTACPSGWQTTGNLLSDVDLRVDTSQLAGGTFYDTWAHAVVLAGSQTVDNLSLLTDSGWAVAGNVQSFGFDNVIVNSDVTTFEPSAEFATKDDCKNYGWQNFGTLFKNQGACVSTLVSDKPMANTTSFSLNSNDENGEDVNTVAGAWYRFRVTGTWSNSGGQDIVDAECTSWNSGPWLNEVRGGAYSLDLLDVQIDKQFVSWGACDPLTHKYSIYVKGTGGPVNVRVFDGDTNTNEQISGWFGDNSGTLNLSVTKL